MTSKTHQSAAAGNAQPLDSNSLFSPSNEKLLLSVIMSESHREISQRLLSMLTPEDFGVMKEHAAIWRAALSLHDRSAPISITTIIEQCRAKGDFVGGTNYIFELADSVSDWAVSDETILLNAKTVKAYSVLRSLKDIFSQGVALCEKPGNAYDQIISLVEDDLLNIRKKSESSRAGPTHVRETLDGLMDRIQRQMEGEKIGVGVPTGFHYLDEITSGLMDEDFIILAARPSMGKTAMLLNLAQNGAKAGQTALIFSLEMKQTALAQRLLGSASRVPLQSLRTASLDGDEAFSRLSEGLHKLSDLPLWIDDTPGLSIHEIRSRARTFVAQHGKCTIYVDYIQHVAKREFQGPTQEERSHVSDVSSGLKGLARELRVPVVGLSQLNRSLETRANKRPIMSDLRESGALEQDADLIMFLYRDEVYNPDTKEPGVMEVIIGKQRDGAIGVVKLAFEKTIGLIQDLSY